MEECLQRCLASPLASDSHAHARKSAILIARRSLLFPKWKNLEICKTKQELRCAVPQDSNQRTERKIGREMKMDEFEKPFRTLFIDNDDSRTQNLYQLLAVGHGVTDEHMKDKTMGPLQPWRCFEDGTTLDLRELWRRSKISQANKGRVPWNKGKHHSPETVQCIKARTLEAMQDPKIREKLKHFGHSQSKETKMKISSALTKWWAVAKATKERQATFITEWQESIANVARRGGQGDEEYQWNSFQMLKKELEGDWKFMAQKKGQKEVALSRNCNKSVDHRKKIAESIRAKWADPNYRLSVNQGIQQYLDRSGRLAVDRSKRPICKKSKPAKTRPSDKSTTTELSENSISSVAKNSPGSAKIASGEHQRPDNVPVFIDPMAKVKLDLVRRIRANRLAKVAKKKEAADRARILMAEAEKAVLTLEIAANKDNDALVSLIETRKLLAEAAQSIQTAGLGKVDEFLASGTEARLMSRGWVNNATSSDKFHSKISSEIPSSLLELKNGHGVSFNNRAVYDNDDDDRNGAPKFFPVEFTSKSGISMSRPSLDINTRPEYISKKQGDFQVTHGRLVTERPAKRKQWVKGRLVMLEVE